MSSKKILILAGGTSQEKDVSVRSGQNIYRCFKDSGFNVDIINPADKDFSFELLKKYDLIYPILHGKQGEDGCIQGVLEILNIPYVGSDVLASAITMNKNITKQLFHSIGIPCAQGFVTTKKEIDDILINIEKIGYPVFVKPVDEGSSIGSLILNNQEEAQQILPKHLKDFPNLLVEQLLIGREMTVGVIETGKELTVLPILELKPKADFYNFETKYTAGMTEFVLPAPMDQDVLELIHTHVITIFKEFNLHDCARIDLMLTNRGPVYLEVNTAPGMTDTSDIPAMLTCAGIDIKSFLTQMITNVEERFSC